MKKATTTTKQTNGSTKRKAPSGVRATTPSAVATNDWRSETLARVRSLIKQADPKALEEVKWRKPSNSMKGVPVWSHDGIICTGETYKSAVKLTFAKGAALEDPAGLFNSSLEGNTRRAIDLHEGDRINERAFKSLVREAAALNASAQVSARRSSRAASKKSVKGV